jgi:2-iminobutanoate/2-iminopropanoate deaminase
MPEKKLVNIKDGPKPIGPYSPAISYGDLIFLSGQIPNDSAATIEEQTKQCLDKIKSLLQASNCSMNDILRCEVFLEDLNDFAKMNEVYAKYFAEPYPARATIGGIKIVKGGKIEIAIVAGKKG